MFRRSAHHTPTEIPFTFDGQPMTARAGDSVAAALLANRVEIFRHSAISGVARGPYCMMGACFECLVTIDGTGNRQSCLTPVEPGMRVQTQRGRRTLQPDVGESVP
jgi:predicted molibdopterin-dependent oxidoreductase YjgC